MEVITTLNEKILSMFPSSVAFVVSKSPIGPFTILILLAVLLLGFIVLLFGFQGPTEEEISKAASPARKGNKKKPANQKKRVQLVTPDEEVTVQTEVKAKSARARNKKKTPFPTKQVQEETKASAPKKPKQEAYRAANPFPAAAPDEPIEDDSEWVVATKGKGNRRSLETKPVNIQAEPQAPPKQAAVQSKRQAKRARKQAAAEMESATPAAATPQQAPEEDEWTVVTNKRSRKSLPQD